MRLTAASCLFLLVLQCQPVALHAQTAPAKRAVSIDPQRMAAANELTEVIFAAQDVQHQLNSLVDGLFQQMAVSDAALKKFMDEHPAMQSELKAAWLPIFTRAASDTQPKMMREVAELYASNLSVDELREVTTFFKTPLGQRLLSGVQANMNLRNATAEIAKGAASDSKAIPDVSQATLDKDRRAAAVRSVASLSAGDLQALEAASARPGMQKIVALSKQRGAIEAKWFNFSDPAAEKEIEKVTDAILTRYLKDSQK